MAATGGQDELLAFDRRKPWSSLGGPWAVSTHRMSAHHAPNMFSVNIHTAPTSPNLSYKSVAVSCILGRCFLPVTMRLASGSDYSMTTLFPSPSPPPHPLILTFSSSTSHPHLLLPTLSSLPFPPSCGLQLANQRPGQASPAPTRK